MALSARLRHNLKGKLSTTLKGWLPILQGDLLEVEEILKEHERDNPFMNIRMPLSSNFSSSFPKPRSSNAAISDKIEQLTMAKESLYECLKRQIIPPLFPTIHSQEIALDILQGISADGYFKEDIEQAARDLAVSVEEYENVRKRFCYLEPKGVGAKDVMESFFFQLEASEVDDDVYELCKTILAQLDRHHTFKHHARYGEAMRMIRRFKNPPAMDFSHEDAYKIPDLFIYEEEGSIAVRTNDECYPIIELDKQDIEIAPNQARMKPQSAQKHTKNASQLAKMQQESLQDKELHSYTKAKVKEAKDLIDALEMRKATLKKVGLMIVEYQYNFFMGGEIKPMKLKDIAQELGYAASTISRAISHKYLECSRGVFAIKSFFTTALEGDVSNAAIKDFVLDVIKQEDRKKPLSDRKILLMIEDQFGLKIVRRTITKYRQQLNIASSSERKKLYEMSAE